MAALSVTKSARTIEIAARVIQTAAHTYYFCERFHSTRYTSYLVHGLLIPWPVTMQSTHPVSTSGGAALLATRARVLLLLVFVVLCCFLYTALNVTCVYCA